MTDDLKPKILSASEALLTEVGYAAFSMREVARRAGVSHQAPYHHFRDKEAIVAALVERGFLLLSQRLEAQLLPSHDGPTGAGRAYVQFALDEPGLFRLMFRPDLVDLSRHPTAQAAANRAFALLQGLAVGAPPAVNAQQAAASVALHWSVAHGLATLLLDGPLGLAHPEPAAREALIDATLALFTGGRLPAVSPGRVP